MAWTVAAPGVGVPPSGCLHHAVRQERTGHATGAFGVLLGCRGGEGTTGLGTCWAGHACRVGVFGTAATSSV